MIAAASLPDAAPGVASPAGQPLRVALVHVADFGGGAERSVLSLHRSLRAAGHHSTLYVGTRRLEEGEPGVVEIPRTRPVPGVLRATRWLENKRGLQALYAPWFRSLGRLIAETDRTVDLVNVHTLWGGQYGYADLVGLRKLARTYPTVLTLRESWMLTGHCACPFSCDRWLSGCGRCPDLTRAPAVPVDSTAINWRRKRRAVQGAPLRVTAVSHWMAEQVRRSPIFAGKPVDVVHNGFDAGVFRPGGDAVGNGDARAEARRLLGLPADETLVLMCGQAVEGVREGIAWHGVAAMNQTSRGRAAALLVGHSAELRAKECECPVRTLPFQDSPERMAMVYRAADLTIVPSEFESFGRVAAESMACGTPVIAFATGGLTDIVDAPGTGWLVPTGDVDGLSAALEEALSDPEDRRQRGAAAAESARSRFSDAAVLPQYVSVFEKAARRPSRYPELTA